jgi:hypothetical protein
MKNKAVVLLFLGVIIMLVMAGGVSAQSFPLNYLTTQAKPVNSAGVQSIATHVADTISYQGLLEEGGVPVTGTRDMDFMLYSDVDCINYVSGYVGISGVQVDNGLFSVQIPFDHAFFNGQQLFLGVEVESAEVACQEILPVPYALSLRPGAKVATESTASEAAALIGEVSSTTPGSYSTGLRGINLGTGLYGIGVHGSQDGSGWGVYGQVDGNGRGVYGKADGDTGVGVFGEGNGSSGVGVYGLATQTGGAGVHAQGSGATGVALKLSSGAIQVSGAGLSSSTPVFIHQATASNIGCSFSQCTLIDHPLTNNDQDAILFVTQNFNYAQYPGTANNPHPVGVQYLTASSRWVIYNVDLSAMTEDALFNVMVVKP